jgi:hypothetical protein
MRAYKNCGAGSGSEVKYAKYYKVDLNTFVLVLLVQKFLVLNYLILKVWFQFALYLKCMIVYVPIIKNELVLCVA